MYSYFLIDLNYQRYFQARQRYRMQRESLPALAFETNPPLIRPA